MTVTARFLEDKVSLKAMTEGDLRTLCKEQGCTDTECDIVRYRVLEELKHREIYERIGYSKSGYYAILRRIKRNDFFRTI